MIMISLSSFSRAGGSENATSARPPDLEKGAHSLVTNSIFIFPPVLSVQSISVSIVSSEIQLHKTKYKFQMTYAIRRK
jgi:hypothetical protein